MPSIRNISGQDLLVPWLGGRLVYDEQTVDVPAAEVTAYTQQETTWAPADEDAEALHQEMLEELAVLIATEGDTAAEMVEETSADDLVKVVIPGLDAEALAELVGAEQARPRPRKTVLAAAEKRAADLGGDDNDKNEED